MLNVEERWKEILEAADKLIPELNKIDGIRITPVEDGSNVYDLVLDKEISLKELSDYLYSEHHIRLRPPDNQGNVKFKVNQTILTRDPDDIIQALRLGTEQARS
jgi:threonine aldolase